MEYRIRRVLVQEIRGENAGWDVMLFRIRCQKKLVAGAVQFS
jgi:hypothetical protein